MPRPKPIEAWHNSPLSMRFTLTQRITLKRLGGVRWIRDQIDKQTKEFNAKNH